jgi:dTMP kinase
MFFPIINIKGNPRKCSQQVITKFSDDFLLHRESMLKLLQSGTTIVCDRYAYSGVAFSASKGLDIEWCKDADRGLPEPDLVLYLDLSVQDAMKRGGFGNELYEKEDVQRAVKLIYEKQLYDRNYWKTIDANQEMDKVQQELQKLSMELISNSIRWDIAPLWNKSPHS